MLYFKWIEDVALFGPVGLARYQAIELAVKLENDRANLLEKHRSDKKAAAARWLEYVSSSSCPHFCSFHRVLLRNFARSRSCPVGRSLLRSNIVHSGFGIPKSIES